MKTSKRLSAALLALLLTLALTACGGGDAYKADSPEMKEIAEINQKIESAYTELTALADENGWTTDESVQSELNALKTAMDACNELLMTPPQKDEVDMPKVMEGFDMILQGIDELRAVVSEPSGEGKGQNASGLVTQQCGGITIDIPADLVANTAEAGTSFKDAAGASLSVTAMNSTDGGSPADVTEDIALQAVIGNLPDAKVLNFDNQMEINGGKTVLAMFSATANGQPVTVTMAYYFPTPEQFCVITMLYPTNGGSSLETNLQAILSSIMPA